MFHVLPFIINYRFMHILHYQCVSLRYCIFIISDQLSQFIAITIAFYYVHIHSRGFTIFFSRVMSMLLHLNYPWAIISIYYLYNCIQIQSCTLCIYFSQLCVLFIQVMLHVLSNHIHAMLVYMSCHVNWYSVLPNYSFHLANFID